MKFKIFKNKLTVAIILLSVTFLILISRSVGRDSATAIENGVGSGFNGVQGALYSVTSGMKNSVGFIFNFSDVKKENEELTARNAELEKQLVEYNAIKGENTRLSNMVNFKNSNANYNYVGCNVVSVSGSGYLDQFIIDRGSGDGIAKNMVAITGEGLVGQVTFVSKNYSMVQTLSNENLAVSAMVESTNENNGILKGYKESGNSQLAKLYYLPIDSTIKAEDIILTSGLGGLYPKGIRIGTVLSVEEDKGKVMKTALIKPFVELNKIQELFIVVPKNKIDVTY
ncbi:MAG TPA: rod shape-determining protein MreC [Clostridiaceae bacterium]